MSDFLKNLRSSHKKSSDPRRNLDGHYYSNQERRVVKDRRAAQHPENLEQLWTQLTDILPQIADTSAALAVFIEQFQDKNDRLIESKIRQNEEVTTFFKHLNSLLDDEALMSLFTKPTKPTASYASGTHYTKDEILDLMKNLRDKGATFGEIAEHLVKQDIPTFSGKGQWHAQTVHRLCKD